MTEDVCPFKCDPLSLGEQFLTFIFGLRDPAGEGTTAFRKVENYSPNDRPSHLLAVGVFTVVYLHTFCHRSCT